MALLISACAPAKKMEVTPRFVPVQEIIAKKPLPPQKSRSEKEKIPLTESFPHHPGSEQANKPKVCFLPQATDSKQATLIWDVLRRQGEENSSYGLYTYVLFGHKLDNLLIMNPAILTRYNNLLNGIISCNQEDTKDTSPPKSESNIFYIPCNTTYLPDDDPLSRYNSKLAINYLAAFSKVVSDKLKKYLETCPGPFLISTLEPLNSTNKEIYTNIELPRSKLTETQPLKSRIIQGEGRNPVLYLDLSKTNPADMGKIITAYQQRFKPAALAVNKVKRLEVIKQNLLDLIVNPEDNLRIIYTNLPDWVEHIKQTINRKVAQ